METFVCDSHSCLKGLKSEEVHSYVTESSMILITNPETGAQFEETIEIVHAFCSPECFFAWGESGVREAT